MIYLQDLLNFLEEIAPASFAYEWDKIGLQIKSSKDQLSKIVVSLDPSIEALQFTANKGAEVFISHHPLIWDPIKQISSHTPLGDKLNIVLQNDISCIAAHTNWDLASGGINDTLAEALDLQEIIPYGGGVPQKWFNTYVSAPQTHVDVLLDALDKINVGVIEQYRRCAFTFKGTGTFKPTGSADPHIGQVDQIESVEETALFTIVPSAKLRLAQKVLEEAHPYETPFISFMPLEGNHVQPLGRIGKLKQELSFQNFVNYVDQSLSTKCLAWGNGGRTVSKIAVVGGAAGKEWREAQEAGAEVFVTGEISHSTALEAFESGMLMVQAGHYATENLGCAKLMKILQKRFSLIEVYHFEPSLGTMGKPL